MDKPTSDDYITHMPKHPGCKACMNCKVQRKHCRDQTKARKRKGTETLKIDNPYAGVEIENQQFHGITKSVYFRDPDGTLIEFYTEQMSPEDGLKYMRDQTGLGVSEPLEI